MRDFGVLDMKFGNTNLRCWGNIVYIVYRVISFQIRYSIISRVVVAL